MIPWDIPFVVAVGLSMLVLVLRPELGPVDKVFSFFGIGRLDASVAEALVLGCAGLFGLLFNAAARAGLTESYGGLHLGVAVVTGLGLGLGVAWIAGWCRKM